MRFSIVIPVHNEEKYLPACLEALCNQSYTDYEIIVVDDGSTDRSVEIARSYNARVISIHDSKGMIGKVRQRGCVEARGDIICNIDADCIPTNDWLSKINNDFQQKNVCLVTGPLQTFDGGKRGSFFIFCHNVSLYLSHVIGQPGAYGANLAIRRNVFDRIGGFKTNIRVSEDYHLALSASKYGKVLLNPGLVMLTSSRRIHKGIVKELCRGLYSDLMILMGKIPNIQWHRH